MQLNLHANATTTPKTRAYIQRSPAPVAALAAELGVGETTVRRWKARAQVHDRSHVRHVRNRHLSCGCLTVWTAGHYDFVNKRVWTPGFYERVWVPAHYGTEIRFGRRISIQIGGGHYDNVYRPGYYQTVRERIWTAGRYSTTRRCGRH